MATLTIFDAFVLDLGYGFHALEPDVLKVALLSTAPSSSAQFYGDISGQEVANGNGYTTGGATLSGVSYTEDAGVGTLKATDLVFTASSGSMGSFRYAVLYNSSAVSERLIGYWDYGDPVTLAAGDSFTIDFDATDGILTISKVA